MNRTLHIRTHLGWSQKRLAEYLGLAQSAVARMELGQPESGPVRKLLDLLEARLAAGESIAIPESREVSA